MSHVSLMLLVVAGIFLVGSAGEIVFARTRIPDVVWLILCGWALGPASGLLNGKVLVQIAPYFAAFALIVILFNGGTSLKLGSVAKAAPRALLLAVLGFCVSAAAVAFLSMFAKMLGLMPAGWTWMHGALLGSIVGGSSSIIIMPAMTTSKTDHRLADVLNLESTFTDALCVVTASALIALLLQPDRLDGVAALATLGKSFGVAFGIGVGAGMIWLLILNLLRDQEHAYPITLASLLLLYVLIETLGASAAMGVLTFAVVVGNARFFSRKFGMASDIELGVGVRGFHAQMAFIVKSFFFVLIGALLMPPWSLVALGVVMGLVLWAVRIPAVRVATLGGGFKRSDRAVMGVALPRGLAAGVMATIPAAAGVPATRGLATIVFACIVTTIAVFAVGLPFASRRLPPEEAKPQAPEPQAPEPGAGTGEPQGTQAQGGGEVSANAQEEAQAAPNAGIETDQSG